MSIDSTFTAFKQQEPQGRKSSYSLANVASKCSVSLRTWGVSGVVFLSAFLLFQVQPLLGKAILPWFGGTPSVWSTCMLFFQIALFAGYAYAHWLSQRTATIQVLFHAALIGLALVTLPIAPSPNWKPFGDESPTLRILGLLATSVGLPYFILSSTGPLLQSWFRWLEPQASPYRLYALSNAGSLLALISYPFLVEPNLAMHMQVAVWSTLFILFGVGCLFVGTLVWQADARKPESDKLRVKVHDLEAVGNEDPPLNMDRWIWFSLSTVASTLLLATTNQVCQDVASVPFLWIVPLTLYLLTFILCFDGERWYRRGIFAWASGISAGVVCVILLNGSYVPLLVQGGAFFTALFCCCMLCHGELAAMKPHPRFLTSFYLTMSAGGASGGILVNLVAPHVFPAYWELHFSLLACIAMILVVCYRDRKSILFGGRPVAAWLCIGLASFWLTLMLGKDVASTMNRVSRITRGFFGVLRVVESTPSGIPASATDTPLTAAKPAKASTRQRLMVHGRIVHGVQFVDEAFSSDPTAYYSEASGVGRSIIAKQKLGPLRLGMVGLGVGTIATYGRPQDWLRFYEIDPNVLQVAKEEFSYLRDSKSACEIVLGDGRLSLEREAPNAFDILVIDAFSGDAIPTHLLTREAIQVYLRHLKKDGILAVHYSNLHFDLEPVLAGLASDAGLAICRVRSAADESAGIKEAHWALLSRVPGSLKMDEMALAAEPMPLRSILWTDSFNNLFQILRCP